MTIHEQLIEYRGGYDAPMAPPEAVLAVAKEFTQAGVDWQLHT